MPSAAVVNGYDFVLIPQINNGTAFVATINNSAYTVPFFVMAVTVGMVSTNLGSTPGVSGNAPSDADNFISADWASSPWFAVYGQYWTLTTGTALISAAATSPIDSSAQADATKVCMWSTPRASGASNMYVSGVVHTLQPCFPLIMQHAITDGVFTASQVASLRRIPFVLDMDHINNVTFKNDPTRYDKFMSYIPSTGVVWAGEYNASDTDVSNLIGTELLTRLQADQNKRLRYCYHIHSVTRPQPTTGDWPYVSQGGTLADAVSKTNQDSYYATDKALWESVGLSFADAPLYYNNGAYRFNDDTLALFSPDVSLASSPGNNETKAGYGYTIFRADRNSSRVTPQLNTRRHNQRAIKQTMRGIQLLSIEDINVNTVMPFNTVAKWRDKFKMLMQGLSYGISTLIHDWTFTLPQDPTGANGYAGEVVMQMITDLRLFMTTCDYFANPVNYWHPRTVSA